MPRISEDGKQALAQHVIPKLEKSTCTVCQSSNWVIAESIFELREFWGVGVITAAGQTIPIVVATCHVCGHIVPFNAIHVGVVKVEPTK